MLDALRAYEAQEDDEAIFVKSLDKIMPMMLNIIGQGNSWKKFDLSRSDLIKNKDEKTRSHKEINKIWKVLRQHLLEHDEYFDQGRAD